jgi:drug/metabolite transporter (DMT)-like permease
MHDLEGLLLGLTAALAWGLADTVATVVSRRVGSLRATAGTQLTSVVVLALLVLATGTALPGEPAVAALSLACGVVAAVAYLSFFTALRHGPISVVSPVVSTYGGLTVVLSVLLLGEALAPGQVLGVAVATGGVVLASVSFRGGLRGARPVGTGVAYALVALVAFAALTVTLAGPIRATGWLPVLFLARIANAGTVWLILGSSRLARPADPGSAAGRSLDRRALGLVLAAGLLDIGGFIAFAVGLQVSRTWLVGITSSFGPVIAVAAGVVLFGERPRPLQWLGLGFVAASVFLIALG